MGVGVEIGVDVAAGVEVEVGVDVAPEVEVEVGVDVASEAGVDVGVGDSLLVGADVGGAQAGKLTANSNDRIISINGTTVFRFTSVPLFAFNLSYNPKLLGSILPFPVIHKQSFPLLHMLC